MQSLVSLGISKTGSMETLPLYQAFLLIIHHAYKQEVWPIFLSGWERPTNIPQQFDDQFPSMLLKSIRSYKELTKENDDCKKQIQNLVAEIKSLRTFPESKKDDFFACIGYVLSTPP